MKSDPNSEDYYLELCRMMVEEKLGWGSSKTWSHSDFVEASEKVSQESGINLSVTTIKRIWGKVKYQGTPAASTLNALALYLGFENWRSFKISQAVDDESSSEQEKLSLKKVQQPGEWVEEKTPKTEGKWKTLTPFVFALILLISVLFIQSAGEHDPEQILMENIVFNSDPVTSGLPNTVIFNYDISDVDFDSAFIQQNWDARRRQRIDKENKQITSVYYYPGHFNAKLVIDNKVVKEHGLLIPSQGWLGLVDREGSTAPVYFKKPQFVGKGTLYVPSDSLEAKKIDIGKDFWLTYSNAREFGINGDDFTFEAAIRNKLDDGGGVCQESAVLIDGENGIFWIPLTSLGCVGNINLQFGDVFVSGKTTDLSAFGADLSRWNFIRLQVKNKHVELLVDDQLFYAVEYKEPIGKVMGINFRFQGAGEVDYVRLMDEAGALIYEDEFLPEGKN